MKIGELRLVVPGQRMDIECRDVDLTTDEFLTLVKLAEQVSAMTVELEKLKVELEKLRTGKQ